MSNTLALLTATFTVGDVQMNNWSDLCQSVARNTVRDGHTSTGALSISQFFVELSWSKRKHVAVLVAVNVNTGIQYRLSMCGSVITRTETSLESDKHAMYCRAYEQA